MVSTPKHPGSWGALLVGADRPWYHHLPNLLTLLRLVLLPLFVVLVVRHNQAVANDPFTPSRTNLIAGMVLLVIGLSDVVDGALARRFDAITPLGKVLDPVADKLAQITGLILFTFFASPGFAEIPLFLLASIVARDLMLATGTLLLKRRQTLEIIPRFSGKAATLLTFALLVAICFAVPQPWVLMLTALAEFFILTSMIVYFHAGTRLWRRAHPSLAQSGKDH